MKNKSFNKIMAMVVVFVMSFGTACIVNEKEVKETQAWAGIGYIAAKKGVSAEAGLAIGVIGAWEGTLQGGPASVLFRSTWSNGSTHKTQCRPDKGGIVAFTTCQPSAGTAFSLPNSTVKCYCAINGELPYCTSNGSPVTSGKSLPARNTIFRLPPSPNIWTFTSSSANLKTSRSASGQLSSSGK